MCGGRSSLIRCRHEACDRNRWRRAPQDPLTSQAHVGPTARTPPIGRARRCGRRQQPRSVRSQPASETFGNESHTDRLPIPRPQEPRALTQDDKKDAVSRQNIRFGTPSLATAALAAGRSRSGIVVSRHETGAGVLSAKQSDLCPCATQSGAGRGQSWSRVRGQPPRGSGSAGKGGSLARQRKADRKAKRVALLYRAKRSRSVGSWSRA